ncbi:ACT domain-containing protein [Paenibacillus herberti]|uniref:Amino acid-binding protein n=1 Tax=Paenibacillus herberti TaxID=1619309 RepID=A0A229NWL9_9BACL|nr:ACT domain-containing protein [Paenibacillus herberti]OXM14270.1 amino acid-binding protein [Paenibacillus herberti]
MNLVLLNSTFSIVKLPPRAEVPSWADQGEFFSVSRTHEELSIVCSSSVIPDNTGGEIEQDWKCIKVEGVLDFGLTGILASLANPLAEQEISIFAISTFNTDYLLIKQHSIDKAKAALEKAGHPFI